MKKLLERIQSIISQSPKTFANAVGRLAEDAGVDIAVMRPAFDIVENLPSVENISLAQFRLAIVSAMVRAFDDRHRDTNKISKFSAMYTKFSDLNQLTVADMNLYHTLMFQLNRLPVAVEV